jgi:serine phosphatase RsbU (regulator of sigma subunit)/anti-sigma regulatory factor (Ser/Thr protein kinase)
MFSEQRRRREKKQFEEVVRPDAPAATVSAPEIAIGSDDPFHAYLVSVAAPVGISNLSMKSEALSALKAAEVEIVVPLVGQGELLGALYLGSRLSDQPYSSDDRKLLGNLASQVAPAMQVAQLVREQQAEAQERERIQQEMQVAALIQQTLLPHDLPMRSGWSVDAFYRPARAVGGDFYDFIDLDDGRLGVVIGDVTDKGVPAALVMATCRSMLRAAAHSHASPGAVLAEVNDTLVDEIPPAMFVTCLYAAIDTKTGSMTLANAGHNLPYVRTESGVVELRATGMPLGLMPGMRYEEKSFTLTDGNVMVLTSDGITEAHNSEGEMYGFPRLLGRVAAPVSVAGMVNDVVQDVERHTGSEAEQEDDITLVVVKRNASAASSADVFQNDTNRTGLVTSFTVPSEEGNERLAIDRVNAAIEGLDLDSSRAERLKTAVGETVMNAIEHGNRFQPDLDVSVSVEVQAAFVVVKVTDEGGNASMPVVAAPDLEAKLAGEQTPRGWGMFLIEKMVDEVKTSNEDGRRTVELVINREGGE